VLLGLGIARVVAAADSVVIGHGVGNSFLSEVPCPATNICLDSRYIWTLVADRTVVGPAVKGEVRAIAIQHTEATPQFVHSVELFVLRPIAEATLRSSSGADFYIDALSPRDTAGRYCLAMDPLEVNLHIATSNIHKVDGAYCFDARLL